MRDGGKGDTPRPLGVPIDKFDDNWDAIFGGNKALRKAELEKRLEDMLAECEILRKEEE